MVEFRRIEMSVFPVLLLVFTAATGQTPPNFLVRDGDGVALLCHNPPDQDKCDDADWIFRAPGKAVQLTERGQIRDSARTKSAGLTVAANCDLVLKRVRAEDAGQYTCRRPGRQDAQFNVSVVTLAEQTNGDEATLSCSVSTHGSCDHQVTWLSNGSKLDHLSRHVRTSQSPCAATVTFPALLPAFYYVYTSSFIPFTCQVTDGHMVRRFAFSAETGAALTTATTTRTADEAQMEPEAPPRCSVLDHIMLVIRVFELLLITAITVLLLRARHQNNDPIARQ